MYSGVILKSGEFAGMTTQLARCLDTNSQAWKNSLNVAGNPGSSSNPIGNTLWFNTNNLYQLRTKEILFTKEGYTFDSGKLGSRKGYYWKVYIFSCLSILNKYKWATQEKNIFE